MRDWRLATWCMVGLLVLWAGAAAIAVPAMAQDEAATASGAEAGAAPELPAQERQGSLVEFFVKGGDFMWPLLFCAVLGLAVIIERLFTMQRAHTNTRALMSAVTASLRENRNVEKAKEICMNTRGPIAAILHAGLTKVDRGPAAVEKAIETSGAIEMSFLQRGLVILSSVANIAPLLGFLGTVSGMIHAFEAIAAAEQVSAKIVASGISEALITTLAGLVIAIPVQSMFNYFVARIDRFVTEMEESAVELLDTLTDMDAGKA